MMKMGFVMKRLLSYLDFFPWMIKRQQGTIENLNHNKMLDPFGQAWQNSSALATQTPGRATVNKQLLSGSLLHTLYHPSGRKVAQLDMSLFKMSKGLN